MVEVGSSRTDESLITSYFGPGVGWRGGDCVREKVFEYSKGVPYMWAGIDVTHCIIDKIKNFPLLSLNLKK